MTIHMATITRLTYGPYDHILLVSWSVVLKGNFPFKGLTLTSKKINEVSRKKSVPSYWIDTAFRWNVSPQSPRNPLISVTPS